MLKGDWDTGVRTLPTKTLTGISKYPGMVAGLKTLVGLTPGLDSDPAEVRHWWLNFNPAVWSLAAAALGHTEPYTAQNEAGNNRQKYTHFQAVRPGDLIIGYESTPAKRIAGLGTVTRGLYATDDGAEAFEFEKTADVPDGPTWADLQAMPELEDAEPIRNNQGSLFALTAEEYDRLVALLDAGRPVDLPRPVFPPYTVEDAEAKAFTVPGAVASWVDLLRRRKNVILQGPPGVGKTFLAREVAYALMGARDAERLRFVQFHQSYGYEDFVQGYRPSDDGTFTLKNGLFYSFAESAKKRPDEPHVFIIDEVNRGNLSKIFGELMMLIERDKRGPEHAIPLAYARTDAARFYVPENIHVLGLMNTADRSLAVVDYALRRRFAFVTLEPNLGSSKFAAFLAERGADEALVDRIAKRVGALNRQVTADTDLGAGFCVGHSYFCPAGDEAPDDAWYERVVRNEVGPLLHEYWFDRPQTAEAAIAGLLA
jgi:5-methylcytosine-specific restriction protein B